MVGMDILMEVDDGTLSGELLQAFRDKKIDTTKPPDTQSEPFYAVGSGSPDIGELDPDGFVDISDKFFGAAASCTELVDTVRECQPAKPLRTATLCPRASPTSHSPSPIASPTLSPMASSTPDLTIVTDSDWDAAQVGNGSTAPQDDPGPLPDLEVMLGGKQIRLDAAIFDQRQAIVAIPKKMKTLADQALANGGFLRLTSACSSTGGNDATPRKRTKSGSSGEIRSRKAKSRKRVISTSSSDKSSGIGTDDEPTYYVGSLSQKERDKLNKLEEVPQKKLDADIFDSGVNSESPDKSVPILGAQARVAKNPVRYKRPVVETESTVTTVAQKPRRFEEVKKKSWFNKKIKKMVERMPSVSAMGTRRNTDRAQMTSRAKEEARKESVEPSELARFFVKFQSKSKPEADGKREVFRFDASQSGSANSTSNTCTGSLKCKTERSNAAFLHRSKENAAPKLKPPTLLSASTVSMLKPAPAGQNFDGARQCREQYEKNAALPKIKKITAPRVSAIKSIVSAIPRPISNAISKDKAQCVDLCPVQMWMTFWDMAIPDRTDLVIESIVREGEDCEDWIFDEFSPVPTEQCRAVEHDVLSNENSRSVDFHGLEEFRRECVEEIRANMTVKAMKLRLAECQPRKSNLGIDDPSLFSERFCGVRKFSPCDELAENNYATLPSGRFRFPHRGSSTKLTLSYGRMCQQVDSYRDQWRSGLDDRAIMSANAMCHLQNPSRVGSEVDFHYLDGYKRTVEFVDKHFGSPTRARISKSNTRRGFMAPKSRPLDVQLALGAAVHQWLRWRQDYNLQRQSFQVGTVPVHSEGRRRSRNGSRRGNRKRHAEMGENVSNLVILTTGMDCPEPSKRRRVVVSGSENDARRSRSGSKLVVRDYRPSARRVKVHEPGELSSSSSGSSLCSTARVADFGPIRKLPDLVPCI